MTPFGFASGILSLGLLALPVAHAQDISRSSMTINGKPMTVITHVYKPAGNGPFPVVVYLHGRPPPQFMRSSLTPVERDHAKFWTERGAAVVGFVRPGYVPTGGDDAELPFAEKEVDGKMQTRNIFATSTANGADAAMAAIDWVRAQPWARKDKLLIEGQSMGGLLASITSGRNPEGVVGAISFAGGVGRTPNQPGKGREPEALTPLHAEAGSKSRMPMLWISAANDSYFGPEVVNMWFDAYKAGNKDSTLLITAPTSGDGHDLIRTNPELFAASLDEFAARTGFLKP